MNQLFKYGENEVRTVMIEGEPWFVAKDVCAILEHSDVSMATKRLDDDEKLTQTMFVSGQNRAVVVVNESGLYSLILTSRKPEAKAFRKWITSEVLPMIRKTGGYVNNDDLFINTYMPYADETTKLLFRTTLGTIRHQTEKIAELEPKADKYDEFLDSDGLTTLTTVGKHFLNGMTSQQVRKWLQDSGVLYKRKVDGCYPPVDRYSKYFRIIPYVKNGWVSGRTVKVTTEGIDFILDLRKEVVA